MITIVRTTREKSLRPITCCLPCHAFCCPLPVWLLINRQRGSASHLTADDHVLTPRDLRSHHVRACLSAAHARVYLRDTTGDAHGISVIKWSHFRSRSYQQTVNHPPEMRTALDFFYQPRSTVTVEEIFPIQTAFICFK